MPNTYFISDTHFWHRNIIKYSNRPYATDEQKAGVIPDECIVAMNEGMIANWNNVIGQYDHVYHLGDVSFARDIRDTENILRRLNGIKHLIRGNHDSDAVCRLPQWDSVDSYKEIRLNRKHIVLCHYAMRVWNRSHNGSIMLYGHSHGGLPGTDQSLDVGVDCWDYKPVDLEQIERRLRTNPPARDARHHNL